MMPSWAEWHWVWGPWAIGMGLGMLVFWVLIIVGIVAAIRWLITTSRQTRPPEESPLESLKRRYARGEIDQAEFEERRRDLER